MLARCLSSQRAPKAMLLLAQRRGAAASLVGTSVPRPQQQPLHLQKRANVIPPQPLTRLDHELPRYFELFQDHMQTFNRFSSDPPWVMEALAEKSQSVQSYFVEDSVRHQFDDSMMNVVSYFSQTHGCILLDCDRSFSKGLATHTRVTLEVFYPMEAPPAPTQHIDASQPKKTKRVKLIKKKKPSKDTTSA